MKNIKLRIVYLILCSALLLFALFMLAVNLIIPAHFVSEAKKALISEAEYQNRTIPYTDDESFFDDEWNDAEEHFLTPSIVFLELDNTNQSSGWNRDAYRLEKKLLEYCAGRDIALNQCYTFKTDRHHLIFMSVQEDYGDGEEPYSYIMYIDIGPITRYIVTLNWAFFGVLLAISSVMCLLGFRFGRDIEKEAERQQTFFQNASHELKTPIALIQGYAEGLQDNINDDEESRQFYCDVIIDEAGKMNQMVKKLLTLNQLEFGNDQVNMERFDLTSLIQGVIQSSQILAQQAEVEIMFHQTEPLHVWGDEFKVEEVITNYVTNAIHYAKNEKKIDIRCTQENGVIRTSVFNTGDAIPEEELDKIWIKFYKVDKARTREYGGSGIGLSIVKAIMESMNQQCGVKNYDNGVEFWFTLDTTLSGNQE